VVEPRSRGTLELPLLVKVCLSCLSGGLKVTLSLSFPFLSLGQFRPSFTPRWAILDVLYYLSVGLFNYYSSSVVVSGCINIIITVVTVVAFLPKVCIQ